MSQLIPYSLAFVLACALLKSRLTKHASSSSGPNFPPGPKPLWVLGNALDLPLVYFWNKFHEWSKVYGDVVGFNILGNKFVVLNSLPVLKDLFEKRGSIYSDRPSFVVIGELAGFERGLVMRHYGESWRTQRKIIRRGFDLEVTKKYWVRQEEVVNTFLQSLLQSPNRFQKHLRLAMGQLILSATYGIHVDRPDHPLLKDVEAALVAVGEGIKPGAYIVDLIPSLKCLPSWLPFVRRWHRDAKKANIALLNSIHNTFNYSKETVMSGSSISSFVTDSLTSEEASKDPEIYETELKWAAGNLFGAGVESTYSAILSFFLAMANYPEVQARAQEELDSILKNERLPSLNDRPNLPYVNAIVKEVLRWKPPVPLGVPRRLLSDDDYQGHTIPMGCTVIPNLWTLSRDVKDPETFDPSRFLGTDTTEASDPSNYIFGFGRRICPGRHFADGSLFLFMSSVLTAFKIYAPEPLTPKYTSGITSFAEEFECSITPRSRKAAELVEKAI